MDDVLDMLAKQAGRFSNTIEKARVRTRVMGRKLRGVAVLDPAQAAALLELESAPLDTGDDADDDTSDA